MRASPAGWGEDCLSEFVDLARHNLFATFDNKKPQYAKLQNIDDVYLQLLDDLTDPDDPLVAVLGLRSHAAYRGAVILAMMGLLVEASAVCRTMLESAGYALIVSCKPTLGEVFLNRSSSISGRNRVRREFSHSKVVATLNTLDHEKAKRYSKLYETLIDFGGHPNEQGVTGSLTIEESESLKRISSQYLHGDGIALDFSMKTIARTSVCALETLELAMEREFRERGASSALATLQRGL